MLRAKLPYMLFIFFLYITCCFSQQDHMRSKTLIDSGWQFAFGHLYDTEKDFGYGTAYFSYLAKAGNGDGPAAPGFDDRAWRLLDLPHDWAVEQPFDEKASYSHGFKVSGKGYTERSVGWYRKKISIPDGDLGRIISLKFDGVFRNSKVWFNGHFLGTEESGYNGFEYDITAYINYGGENTIAVRVDASMEEGWFYEGAGIYRHVWLQKVNPFHIADNGTYVTTEISEGKALVHIQATVENKGNSSGEAELIQHVIDPQGKEVAVNTQRVLLPGFYKTWTYNTTVNINNPLLWDVDNPNLYRLITEVKYLGKTVDSYETTFGIRSIHFDPETGFYLNGKSLKLKGTNNHQDHAGIGVALPDEMQYFRIQKLKEMGSNAYRCSHNPPTPELLEACDRLGMLVIDETRLMGINQMHLDNVRRMIERDRNHPSIICWSVGNEEWAIEGNIAGERITEVMQEFVHGIEPTRPVTVGISSGFKSGISSVVEIMGYNYLGNGDIDAHRNGFKQQPGMGTEEGSTFATRGIYVTDDTKHYKSAYDQKPRPTFYSIEEGWKFYATRPYLAGMFIWTGFDYRGEPTPYGWPSVTSYFGMMDVCGFAKDNVYYLNSWWGKEPVIHLLPHWSWPGMEGREIDVWVYSNCDEVELLLNKKSLGKKKMEEYGHLEWKVTYQPGTLEAIGYKNGKKVLSDVQNTTGKPASVKLTPHKQTIKGNGDVSVITVEVLDSKGLHVPVADNEIMFDIKGGTIIGVGNGNPTSLEKDTFIDGISVAGIEGLSEQALTSLESPESLPDYPDNWQKAFKDRDYKDQAAAYAYKGEFSLPKLAKGALVTFFYQKIGQEGMIFVNGNKITASADDPQKYILDANILKEGINEIHIITTPLKRLREWDVMNTNPGVIQVITPAGQWKRKLFNGYAQVIIKADSSGGNIVLTAKAIGIKPSQLEIEKQ